MDTSSYIMQISHNGKTIDVQMTENQTTDQLRELMEKGDIKVRLQPYGGFERVGALPKMLKTSDRRMNVSTGEVVLYTGDNIVIMLGENSWSYTPLGHIDLSRDQLESFFGKSTIDVMLSLNKLVD